MIDIDVALVRQKTRDWVNSFIIEHNICPFAKRVVNQDTLLIDVAVMNELELALNALTASISQLNTHPEIETTLLVFPVWLACFYDYLDFVDLAERALSEQGYDGVYQLATFHPDYCFAGVDSHDVSNYTNRSPYPMVHLLRESSLDKAIAYYGDTSQIPENNIAKMRELGLKKIIQ